MYQDRKQTVAELAQMYKVSESTIKRRLSEIKREWVQPALFGGGYVHLDVTYWGRGHGVLVALDSLTNKPLYLSIVGNETNKDYLDAVESIELRGYQIKGIIIDGREGLFKALSNYPIQMCQYHMQEIVKRYLTKRPKLLAARALRDLVGRMSNMNKDDFESEYQLWKTEWHKVLTRRSKHRDGTSRYTHARLRSAMNSIDRFLPHLFIFQLPECQGMPNTNNKLEGTFTDLKKNLNNHSGMSAENRCRFIFGFFLAYAALHNTKRR